MMTNSQRVREIRRQIELGHKRVEYLENQLADLESKLTKFGDDDWEEETVFMFKKNFHGKEYLYTAVKCDNGRWYTSGPKFQGPFTWDELTHFMLDVKKIWIAHEWREW